MTSHSQNFKAWYADVLRSLYPQREAGFVILLSAFPLLERYLRQKAQLAPDATLNATFFNELMTLFPEVQSAATAEAFWQVYRNGLLHQVTFSDRRRSGSPLPNGWISHDMSTLLDIASDGSFWLHPVSFAERVLRAIESDFATFEGILSGTPDLPAISFGSDMTASGVQHNSSPYPHNWKRP